MSGLHLVGRGLELSGHEERVALGDSERSAADLGLTREFVRLAEREHERVERERVSADQELADARAARDRLEARCHAIEQLLNGDPEKRGHDREFVRLAEREREHLERARAVADRRVAKAQSKRDHLASQLGELQRLLADDPEKLAEPTAPAADANAVLELLIDRSKPMHYRDIYSALADVGFQVGGADPASTLLTRFFNDGRLERVARGTYQVREDYNCVWWTGTPTESGVLSDVWQVLSDFSSPLHYTEIAEAVYDLEEDTRRAYEEGFSGTRQEEIDDLAGIVNHLIASHIKQHGGRSDFRRVGPVGYGTYTRG